LEGVRIGQPVGPDWAQLGQLEVRAEHLEQIASGCFRSLGQIKGDGEAQALGDQGDSDQGKGRGMIRRIEGRN
jgi:hypothetical protein